MQNGFSCSIKKEKPFSYQKNRQQVLWIKLWIMWITMVMKNPILWISDLFIPNLRINL